MIVPAAFVAMGSGEAVAANSGPSLMFVILPTVFADMGGAATIVGFLFFLLVLFAALTSAISLTETCTSIVQDGAGWSRKGAVRRHRVVTVGIFVNLGYNGLSFIEPMKGHTLLDFFGSFISSSAVMPIVIFSRHLRRLDHQAEGHRRRGEDLQRVQGGESLDRHHQVRGAGARGGHPRCVRRADVRAHQLLAFRRIQAFIAGAAGHSVSFQ